jgi:MerR family transcriptional regulator, light-induced transcriptional regulator
MAACSYRVRVLPAADGLTIGQVSQLLGVPVPTLRSWHHRYGVAATGRTRGGHRRYSSADVERLQSLASAVSRGIAPRTAARAVLEATPAPDAPTPLLARLIDAATACDQVAIRAVLDRCEHDLGTEIAVDALLVPGLRDVGRRWELGLVDVGVEHVVTAEVRRWIARRTGTTPLRAVRPVLLAAAPGNRHTVALEAFGMILDRRGWPTCQLGADSPVSAIRTALTTSGATAAVVTAHQVSRRRAAIGALAALRSERISLFFAGAAFDSARHRRDVPGRYLGTVLPDAADVVRQALAGG